MSDQTSWSWAILTNMIILLFHYFLSKNTQTPISQNHAPPNWSYNSSSFADWRDKRKGMVTQLGPDNKDEKQITNLPRYWSTKESYVGLVSVMQYSTLSLPAAQPGEITSIIVFWKEHLCINHEDQNNGSFQFEIVMNVVASSFQFTWILTVYVMAGLRPLEIF